MTRNWLINIFGIIGFKIGKYPLISIGIFILINILPVLIGIFWIGTKLKIGLDDGFIPLNSPSKKEISAQKYFFGKTENSKEWYMALFGISNSEINGDSSGNMLELNNYNKFKSFYERIINNMTINGFNNITYSNICHPFCDINDQFIKLMEYSSSFLKTLGQIKFSYPISKILNYNVNIGKHIFNRSINNNKELKSANLIALYFSTFINNNTIELFLNKFEEKVAEEAKIFNFNNKNIQILVHGSNIVQKEIKKGVINTGKIFIISFFISIILFILIHLLSGLFYSQFTLIRGIIALICIPAIFLNLLAIFGVISLFRYPINLLHFTTPIIEYIILFSAHGTFQLGDIWCRLLNESKLKQYSSSERLSKVFEKIGPSLLYSHLWPFFAFLIILIILPTSLYYKSLFLTLILIFIYSFLFKILFFAPLLSYFCHYSNNHIPFNFFKFNSNQSIKEFYNNNEENQQPNIQQLRSKNEKELINKRKNNKKYLKLSSKQKRKLKFYGEYIFNYYFNYLINSFIGKCFCFLIFILLLFLSFWQGIPSIKNNMNYQNILPKESKQVIKSFNIMDYIWNDFLQILFIIQQPPNFENVKQFGEFKNFLYEATSLNQTLNSSAHMSWLFDYYNNKQNEDILKYLHKNKSIIINNSNKFNYVNMSKFESFINEFPYNAWKSGVNYKINFDNIKNISSIKINQMLILFAYKNTKGLSGKRKLINECRNIAKNYPQFKINIFDTDLITTDIMNTIDLIIWRLLLSLFISLIICINLIMNWHFILSIIYILSTISLFSMIFGFGQYIFNFEINLMTTPTIIIISILGIQLFIDQFLLRDLIFSWANEIPIKKTLKYTFSSIIKIFPIWLALILPLIFFVQVPYFKLQGFLFLLVALLSLFYILILLPTIINILPKKLII